jgi:excisionase family DNA binding protein
MEKLKSNWLTIPEAAEYLRCGERILREFVTNKEIPHVVFAGKALFYQARIDEWLLEQERPSKPMITDSQKDAELSEDARRIKPDCHRDEVDSLIKELIQYKDGKERFVNGLGRNLRKDLKEFHYELLSPKVFSQLSRWTHPAKPSPRNDWAQEKAQKISKLLFGKVIDRLYHPSYRS